MADDLFLLFECAPGLLLARVKAWDEVGQDAAALQEACLDFQRFRQVVQTVAFHPFSNAEEALEVQLAITGGTTCPTITDFLHFNLPAQLKKKRHKSSSEAAENSETAFHGSEGSTNASSSAIGVVDPALGKSLADAGFRIVYNANIVELMRGCRQHMQKLTQQLQELPVEKFQVGLGHSYSRSKMQEDPRKQDKPVMQSIALLDTLDKNINAFAMKLKEWYGWHFPELVKIVPDTEAYCKVLKAVQIKENFNEQERRSDLLDACGGNEEVVEEILFAVKHSMGQEISDAEFENISKLADQVLRLCDQRKGLQDYLSSKMNFVSPNLKAVLGEVLAARLISHAGSLVNLAKYPASTIQILGAEKALFRALKAKSGKTPKYGLLFHSSFIGRVKKQQHRGRMSRYLASKCALAARIDAFTEEGQEVAAPADSTDSSSVRPNIYGVKLREQLEEKLKYLADGITPRKNLEVMREAASEMQAAAAAARKLRKKRKKRAAAEEGEDGERSQEAGGGAAANPLLGETERDGKGVATEGQKRKKRKKSREANVTGATAENAVAAAGNKEEEQQQTHAKDLENPPLRRMSHHVGDETKKKKKKKSKTHSAAAKATGVVDE